VAALLPRPAARRSMAGRPTGAAPTSVRRWGFDRTSLCPRIHARYGKSVAARQTQHLAVRRRVGPSHAWRRPVV